MRTRGEIVANKGLLMQYVEYATSAGPGTLIEHGVCESNRTIEMWLGSADYCEAEFSADSRRYGSGRITPERYDEFIAIHGGERAV
jgi:hypothetical protein